MTGPGQPPPPAQEQEKWRPSATQILAGILLVLVVIFVFENMADVKIRFIAGPKVKVPVYLALLVALVVGALIGALLRYRRKHKRES